MLVPLFLVALSSPGLCSEVGTSASQGAPWRILPDESVFAVVTQKAGFAARLAHNHLIVARGYTASLDFDPDRPVATTLTFETRVADLVVDDESERVRWEPSIVAFDLVPELGTPGESDRVKIRSEMLAEGQLDAMSHPTLSARLVAVRREVTTIASGRFDYVADVEVQIRGQSVKRVIPARFELDRRDPGSSAAISRVTIEAVGRFTFEEFGIQPYSAFMGSVKNRNEFSIYINLKAVR